MKEISKEECLKLTMDGLKTAIESGKNSIDNLEIILDDFVDEISRMALRQYASLIQTVGEYLATNTDFYERVLASDPEDSVYLEEENQLLFSTREAYEEMMAENERKMSYML